MSKVKLLLDVVNDLHSLADSLQAVADAMTQSQPEEETPAADTEKKTKKADTKKAELAPSPVLEEKPLTLEEVRAVLAEKSRAGHTAEVRAFLLKHGADKLSEVDPAEYPALLADVEVL